MLRSIPCPFLEPKILAGKLISTAGTPSVSVSPNHFSSIADNSTGDFTLNLKTPYARAPLAFVTNGVDVADGGYAGITSSSISSVRAVTRIANGSAGDGTAYFMLLGSKQRDKNHIWPAANMLRSGRKQTQLYTFRVKGTGTADLLSNVHWATLTDNNTGDYTITFRFPFTKCVGLASISGTTAGRINVDQANSDNSAIRIKTFNTSGSATDFDFNLWVVGWNTSYDGECYGASVKAPGVAPRFLFGQITITGGTPDLTEGAGAFTVADGGAGIYDLTIVRPFKSIPEVLVCADGSKTANVASQSTSAIQVRSFSGASASDAAFVNFAVLGYDI